MEVIKRLLYKEGKQIGGLQGHKLDRMGNWMEKIFIFSDNVFYYLAVRNIIIEILKISNVEKLNHKSNTLFEDNLVIIILDETYLRKNVELYYYVRKQTTDARIVVVGTLSACVIFKVITGYASSSIDIKSSIRNLAEMLRLRVTDTNKQRTKEINTNITYEEVETMRMISMGYSMNEIAYFKEKSVKTISRYKCNYFKKIGLKNNAMNMMNLSRYFNLYVD